VCLLLAGSAAIGSGVLLLIPCNRRSATPTGAECSASTAWAFTNSQTLFVDQPLRKSGGLATVLAAAGCEEGDDGGVEAVVTVASDHMAGSGHVGELGVGDEGE
jgi:hypothetical protein